jgi:uncharacterized membrane protein
MKHPFFAVTAVIGVVLAAVLVALGHWQGVFAVVPNVAWCLYYGFDGLSYREEAERNTELAKTSAISRWRSPGA